MLSLYVVLPLLTAVALIQGVLLAPLTILGGHPDLVLLTVLIWAFLRGTAEGAVWAFIGGLLLDLFSGGPLGGMTLALLLVAIFVSGRWGQGLGLTLLQLVLLVLVACFAYHVLLLLTLSWTGHPVDWQYSLARVAAPSAVLNALLAPFVHRPLAWLERKTRSEGLVLHGA